MQVSRQLSCNAFTFQTGAMETPERCINKLITNVWVCVQGGIVVLVGLAGGILPVPIGTTIMNQISVVGTYVGDKPMVGEVLQLMAEKKV